MHICASQFSKFPGEHAPGPPRGGEGKPSLWSLRDHKFWGLRIPPPPWLKSWIRHCFEITFLSLRNTRRYNEAKEEKAGPAFDLYCLRPFVEALSGRRNSSRTDREPSFCRLVLQPRPIKLKWVESRRVSVQVRSLIFLILYPKIVKNAYLRIAIFNISRGSMPRIPPRGGEGKPSPWSLRDHKFWGLRIPRTPPPPCVTQILDPPLTLEQHKIPKIAYNVLEKRPLRGSVPNIKTKALAIRKLKGKEKSENEHTDTASFMYR